MRKPLALVAIIPLVLALTARSADPEPRSVLEKAIAAHGGERLAKARLLVRSAKGQLDAFAQTMPFTGEAHFQLPEQARWRWNPCQVAEQMLGGLRGLRTKNRAIRRFLRARSHSGPPKRIFMSLSCAAHLSLLPSQQKRPGTASG